MGTLVHYQLRALSIIPKCSIKLCMAGWDKDLDFWDFTPLDVKICKFFFEAIPKSSGLDPNDCRSSYTTGCLK